jgi:outer membrane lipoprotein-sorting protein
MSRNKFRVDVSQELLNQANEDENFLKNIINGDETWVYGYDIETKAQSNEDENFLKNIITGDETWVYGYDVETKAQSSQWVSEGS